jgi:hypothetical protein
LFSNIEVQAGSAREVFVQEARSKPCIPTNQDRGRKMNIDQAIAFVLGLQRHTGIKQLHLKLQIAALECCRKLKPADFI